MPKPPPPRSHSDLLCQELYALRDAVATSKQEKEPAAEPDGAERNHEPNELPPAGEQPAPEGWR